MMKMLDWRKEIEARLSYLNLDPMREAEIVEELSQHLEFRYAELLAGGASQAQAESTALLELSAHELLAKELRVVECPIGREADIPGARKTNLLRDILQDLRFGLRVLRRSPGFAAVAVLSLSLGIGANSAIFTALDAVLWRPLPVKDPRGLVLVGITRADRDDTYQVPSALTDALSVSSVFSDVITVASDGLSFSYDGRAERIVGEVVSTNFYTALGLSPALGAGFTPEAHAGHWAPEAVLSYRFWKQRFGGDPGVIGRTIHLNAYPFTVVGVSPSSFFDVTRGFEPEVRLARLPPGQELSQIGLISGSPDNRLQVIARLAPGVARAQAEAIAEAGLQELLRTKPGISRAGYQHIHLSDGSGGWADEVNRFRAPLFVLFALVAIVLLIACANIANLVLARATARRRELAVRASLGANRSRLVRQMLAESMLLSLISGTLAVVVAYWAAPVLLSFLPQGHISLVLDLNPDARALLFTLAVSSFTSVFFGLVPAVHGTRGDLAGILKNDSSASIGEPRWANLRRILVSSQFGLAFVLLIVTGVCLRTVSNLRPAEFQADGDRVLLFTMKPQQELYTPERKLRLVTELTRRVSELPGVQTAALAENGPLGSRTDRGEISASGHESVRADVDLVSPRFFESIGVPLLAGRDFTAADKPGASLVAIINESLARALFKDEAPLGRHLTMRIYDGGVRAFEIVGLVADVHYYEVQGPPRPAAWFAFQVSPPYMPTLHVRVSKGDAPAIVAAVREQFDAIDKGFPVFNIKSLRLRIEDKLSQQRLVADLAGAFAVLALIISAVGLYGVLTFTVVRRTREIGIRMALGATASAMLWMVFKETIKLAMVGVAIGLPLALAATRLIGSRLFGISAADPLTVLAAGSLLAAVAAVASFVPARRAARVDPMVALRYE